MLEIEEAVVLSLNVELDVEFDLDCFGGREVGLLGRERQSSKMSMS
jgi:hypothetical protein